MTATNRPNPNADLRSGEESTLADQKSTVVDIGLFSSNVADAWADALGRQFAAASEYEEPERRDVTAQMMMDPGCVRVIWGPWLADDPGGAGAGPDFLVSLGRSPVGRPIWAPGCLRARRVLQGAAGPRQWWCSDPERPCPGDGCSVALGTGTVPEEDVQLLARYQQDLERLGHAGTWGDEGHAHGAVLGSDLVLVWLDLEVTTPGDAF